MAAEHGIRRNKRKGGQTNPKKANWTTLKLGAFRCWCVGQNQAIFARLPKKDCATSTRSAYSIIPLSCVWCSVSHLHWFGGRQPFLRHLWKYDAASSWALPSSAPKQRWTLSNQSKTWKRVKRWRGVKLYCISFISFRRCCSRPLWTRMKVAVRKWLGCPSVILRMFTNWQNWIIMNNIYHFNLMYDCYYPILPCWLHHQITSRPESSHTV